MYSSIRQTPVDLWDCSHQIWHHSDWMLQIWQINLF